MRFSFFAPLAAALLCGLASASAAPKLLKAARLFDGKSDSLVTPGLILVEGDKIKTVGTASALPPGTEILDLGDATLLPGLMDAHTHLTGESSANWNQDELDYFKKPIPQVAIESVVYARRTLMAGFTTVRDLGSRDLLDVGLRNSIQSGVVVGPRMLVAVHMIGAHGGHGDGTGGYRPELLKEPGVAEGIADGPDQVRAAVRYAAKQGADVIKVGASGGVLSLADRVDSAQYTQAELNALVDEAHALGRKAAAHAHGSEAMKRALRAGIDSIEHGSFADEEALTLIKKGGVYLTITPVLCMVDRLMKSGAPAAILQKALAAQARQEQLLQKALAKDLRIAFGTDAGVCPHGSQWLQLVYMAKSGMKPLAVLRAATAVDAQLLGVDDRLGVLAAGKLADVIAVPGDPSQDMNVMGQVFFVMKEGVVYRHDRRGGS